MRHMQKELLAIGRTGCYFLSIVHTASMIAEESQGHAEGEAEYIDSCTQIIRLFRDAVKNGWCTEECFMQRPDLMMEALLKETVKSVSIKHAGLDYVPKQNEYEITRYEKGSFAHFVCTKGGVIIYDPYGYDIKDLGNPVSKRIFTVTYKDR